MGAGGQEFTAVDPAGAHHRVGIRLPGHYNVANCPCRAGDSRRSRGLPGAGGAGLAANPCPRAARGDRLRPGFSRAGRLRPQAGRVAGGADHPARGRSAGWRWCSAPVATVTRASGRRWARSPPSSPIWSSSPTTTRAVRIRRQSAARSWPGPPQAGGAARVVEIADRRAAIRLRGGLGRPRRRGADRGQRPRNRADARPGRSARSTTGWSWLGALEARRSDRPDHRPDRRDRRRRHWPTSRRRPPRNCTSPAPSNSTRAPSARADCSWRCPGPAPTVTTTRPRRSRPARSPCWRPGRSESPPSWFRPNRARAEPGAGWPGCSSTTPTAPARRCWPRWQSWRRRWPPNWWRAG